MFANEVALKTLVESDLKASKPEKQAILNILRDGLKGNRQGVERKPENILSGERLVVSFKEAAKVLGYSSPRGVYAAVRNKVLQGYYGGSDGTRATGVLVSSIRDRIEGGRSAQ